MRLTAKGREAQLHGGQCSISLAGRNGPLTFQTFAGRKPGARPAIDFSTVRSVKLCCLRVYAGANFLFCPLAYARMPRNWSVPGIT